MEEHVEIIKHKELSFSPREIVMKYYSIDDMFIVKAAGEELARAGRIIVREATIVVASVEKKGAENEDPALVRDSCLVAHNSVRLVIDTRSTIEELEKFEVGERETLRRDGQLWQQHLRAMRLRRERNKSSKHFKENKQPLSNEEEM